MKTFFTGPGRFTEKQILRSQPSAWWNSRTASIEQKPTWIANGDVRFPRKSSTKKIVYPVTLEVAIIAGRIEGEQAARGNMIAFEDLVIGATALDLGFEVVTLNLQHFQHTPASKS